MAAGLSELGLRHSFGFRNSLFGFLLMFYATAAPASLLVQIALRKWIQCDIARLICLRRHMRMLNSCRAKGRKQTIQKT